MKAGTGVVERVADTEGGLLPVLAGATAMAMASSTAVATAVAIMPSVTTSTT